ALTILRTLTGNPAAEFHPGQFEAIEALVAHHRRALVVQRTGWGKSAVYFIAALLQRRAGSGPALIVSPLLALMRDQVAAAERAGVRAAAINSANVTEWGDIERLLDDDAVDVLFVSPERLVNPRFRAEQLPRLVDSAGLLVIDEAHCISDWGHDFRPDYRRIRDLIADLPDGVPVLATTATANARVVEDVAEQMAAGGHEVFTLRGALARDSLRLGVLELGTAWRRLAWLSEHLGDLPGSGIVYCSTRKETESVAERLAGDGYPAACYHAGLGDAERSRSQDDFLYGRVKIIAATNAFGMGIDKSDVRFVIHYNMPQNVESYYQEAGRAGRDGLPADCILFYARRDVNSALFLIRQSNNPDEVVRNRKLLDHMERYCETDGCLRRYILGYFGEKTEEDCGNCENCRGSYDETDVTTDAKKILSHITRLNRAGKRILLAPQRTVKRERDVTAARLTNRARALITFNVHAGDAVAFDVARFLPHAVFGVRAHARACSGFKRFDRQIGTVRHGISSFTQLVCGKKRA
ncbi:MAG: ATP-dependent DNA helicase RecQ, partial [Clostridia bacterium]|nr:ATP-dependent DNA helicase RecQ [Clostridia bacterium]